jgi:hypothetical protein
MESQFGLEYIHAALHLLPHFLFILLSSVQLKTDEFAQKKLNHVKKYWLGWRKFDMEKQFSRDNLCELMLICHHSILFHLLCIFIVYISSITLCSEILSAIQKRFRCTRQDRKIDFFPLCFIIIATYHLIST